MSKCLNCTDFTSCIKRAMENKQVRCVNYDELCRDAEDAMCKIVKLVMEQSEKMLSELSKEIEQ